MATELKDFIRDIPDFPKPGILYRDIAPLLRSPEAFAEAIRQMCAPFEDQQIDVIAAAEARGFIFAGPMSLHLNAGLVPIRKPGKLPYETHSHSYDLEYGSDELHVHIDGVEEGQKVVIVDDLLATGGTMGACCRLLERCGAEIVGCSFLIHLSGLAGEAKLEPYRWESVLVY
ncbi:MAG: adenine phosphoribosyltransferase [Rhodopirellula sp. TMED11]|nr:MAG: adenine phosphoribosyltransferase [Rhodopirellula sp. TMED11]